MKTVLDIEEVNRDQFGHPTRVIGMAYCGDVRLRWTLFFGHHRPCLNIQGHGKTHPTRYLPIHMCSRHWTNREVLPEILNNLMFVIGKEMGRDKGK